MHHQSATVDGPLVRGFPGGDTHIGLRANWRMGRVTEFANRIQKGIRPQRMSTISRSPVPRFRRMTGWNV
jgi:hypothetical protein